MAYTRTNWVSGTTALSATNMNNIEDGIEELKSSTGTTRFTFSSSISGSQGVQGYGFKDNSTGTVRVYFTARFSSTVGSNVSMFSIPSGYRPPSDVAAVCIVIANNVPIAGHATIGTDGTIKQGLTGYCGGITGFAEYQV